MKIFRLLAVTGLVSLMVLSGTATAGDGGVKIKHHGRAQHTREGFTRDVTKTGPKGGVLTEHTVQTPTANGFERNTSVTNSKGLTATRATTGSYDAATKTWTKASNRTNFDGSTASKLTTTSRTEDGYNRDSSMTNRKGVTINRSVDASYDKATHFMDKDISITKTKPTSGTGE